MWSDCLSHIKRFKVAEKKGVGSEIIYKHKALPGNKHRKTNGEVLFGRWPAQDGVQQATGSKA